jgi:hypothetical protein
MWLTLGDALKLVITLLATGQRTALGLKLVHSHGGQSSSAMVGSFVVVNLVDWNGGVHNVRLDSLLLDYRLDSLVDVLTNVKKMRLSRLEQQDTYVVDVLASNSGCDALACCGSLYAPFILKLSLFLNKIPLGGIVITVIELAVLNGTELCSVLLWQNFAVLNWLNSAVVVILVDLLVYCCVYLLVLVGLDRLVNDRRGDCLVDSSVVVSRLAGEVGESGLDFVHVVDSV